jgi:hypothetical protein
MSKLYLHSDNARNNIHYLDENINGRYKLLSLVFTNHMYNITDNNNKIYLNENGSNITATLTNGYFDINDLKTNITTALNAVCSGTISLTVDDNTNKYTFTNDTYNFYFKFGTNTTNSARKLLGYSETDGSNSSSQTSSNPIDLNTNKNIFLHIQENNRMDICGENYFSTSLIINGTGGFGEIFRYINDDNFCQYVDIKNTKMLQIKIHDIDYNSININSEYILILEKC